MKDTRPHWNTYFMAIATIVAQRSLDPSTKVGCVVINNEKSILTTGYNSPPRGMVDENVPLERPEKYKYFSHAEVNAIANAARHGIPLRDSTFYVTSIPCEVCFRSIINSGAKQVVYGSVKTKMSVNSDSKNIVIKMAEESGVELVSYQNFINYKSDDYFELLLKASTNSGQYT